MRLFNSLLGGMVSRSVCYLIGISIIWCCGTCYALPTSVTIADDSVPISKYRRDVKTFITLSKSEDAQAQRNAIFNLCQLHRQLVSDPRFDTNRIIRGFRVTAGKRLKKFIRDQEKKILRVQRLSVHRRRIASKNTTVRMLSSETTENETGEAPDPHGVITGSTGDSRIGSKGDARMDEEYNLASNESATDSYYAMGQFSGGPSQLFNYTGGRMAPPWDHGDELVELIQNTIDPASWRSNGGEGSIRYYRPFRILVVDASMQVQQDTLDLLNKLRAAGR